MSTMEFVLPNGSKLVGTPAQISELASQLGVNFDATQGGKFYLSDSKGLVEIAKMDAVHAKNALLKKLRQRYQDLVSEPSLQVVVEKTLSYKDDMVILNLILHLEKAAKTAVK